MKIYTRTGDDGRTHLCSGPRVIKDDPHVEACGTVDELNATLGVVRSEALPEDIDTLLHRVQHELFCVGADLAMPGPRANQVVQIDDQQVAFLEDQIDRFEAQLAPLGEFILPGGNRSGAMLHLARTVCRRAERRVVTLRHSPPQDGPPGPTVRYLNRLSDLLFVLSRVVNARADINDEAWKKNWL